MRGIFTPAGTNRREEARDNGRSVRQPDPVGPRPPAATARRSQRFDGIKIATSKPKPAIKARARLLAKRDLIAELLKAQPESLRRDEMDKVHRAVTHE